MSGYGNGDAKAYYPVVLKHRLDALDERADDIDHRVEGNSTRVDGLLSDVRTANAGIRSLSETLGHVSEAVIRIETRLGQTEAESSAARKLAERASDSNEYFIDKAELDLAQQKLAIERQKQADAIEVLKRTDSLRAKADTRQVWLDGVKGAGQIVGTIALKAGPILILAATLALRACGVDVVGDVVGLSDGQQNDETP